ncbi:MAG: sugar phosphate isomerase/epimerase family protein [Armatimonadota bacterium]|nr:sugar phosphate isomerase/epimerase [bacterium]MDW8322149.1 sugar phosphate isomerase/epimerase family protein [Armatimonadota bacterium]
MDVCLSIWSFALDFQRHRMDIARFAAVAHELGLDTVELVDYIWLSAGQPLHSLRDAGLRVCAYDTATDFVHIDPALRQQQVKLAYAAVEEAVRLGARLVRLLPGRLKEGVTYEDALQMVIESMSSVARYAHNVGVTAVLEPHEDVVNSAHTLRYVAEQVNSAAFGINADVCTFLLMGLDPVRECAAIGDICKLAHLNDARRVRRNYGVYTYRSVRGERYAGTALGDGEIDIRGCIEALVQAGFRGPFSLEYLGMEEALVGVQKSLHHIRKILQEVEAS